MTGFVMVASDVQGIAGSGNASTVCLPIYLTYDEPSYIYRSASAGSAHVVLDMGPNASYDGVAVIGSNLRSSDTVRIQTGSGSGGTGGYDSGTMPAYQGFKPTKATTKTVVALPSTSTNRYVRVDFSASGHPDGYIQVQQIAVGPGIRYRHKRDTSKTYSDASILNSGVNWNYWEKIAAQPSVKLSTDFVTDADFAKWDNLFVMAGQSTPMLVVPRLDLPTYIQTQAVFGYITSAPKCEHPNHNNWNIEATVTALRA